MEEWKLLIYFHGLLKNYGIYKQIKIMSDIRQEMDQVINELKNKGIHQATNPNEVTGLGDVLESALTKFGITQERYKSWFGLEECGCTERKKWLNGLFSWHTKK